VARGGNLRQRPAPAGGMVSTVRAAAWGPIENLGVVGRRKNNPLLARRGGATWKHGQTPELRKNRRSQKKPKGAATEPARTTLKARVGIGSGRQRLWKDGGAAAPPSPCPRQTFCLGSTLPRGDEKKKRAGASNWRKKILLGRLPFGKSGWAAGTGERTLVARGR